MSRIRYLLLTTLIWVFILAWWAGLVVWVITTRAWPTGSLPYIMWPFCALVLPIPAIMAYLSWEYLWDEECRRRRRADATANLQIRPRPKLHGAEENERSLNSEVAESPQRLLALPKPSLDEASPGPAPTSSGPAAARESEGSNKFLDDFEKKLWERTRSPAKVIIRTSPGSPSEGGDNFLDDVEKAVRRLILEQDQEREARPMVVRGNLSQRRSA